ncbi:hypothetical protein CAPN008_05730 [Capnocytophaga canis]|uniref:hypothetical protein n=1 Tax=Capnocytophaga canis TaxID=1848903 RepID=UPI001562D8E4|nr:hypothetical protein [Capnocytophaga canis]GIM60523.1 hypothetical protein CAPN008_05730 [Capnocytophaga canis]
MKIDNKKKQECLEVIIKRAPAKMIQVFVNAGTPERLGYTYSYIIEEFFEVKKGTSSFGAVVTDIFSEYMINSIKFKELERQINFHKKRFKFTFDFNIVQRRHHMTECNRLVDEQKKIYEPVRKFVRLCNKIKKQV